MWAVHLRQAFRLLLRNRLFSFINIFGLALGFAASLLILRFIQHEVAHDKGFAQADRIYRVATHAELAGPPMDVAVTPIALAERMSEEFPEVEKVARLRLAGRYLLEHEDRSHRVDRLAFADSTTFDLFGLTLALGNPDDALKRPETIVLTPKFATMFFGDDDPLGKTLVLDNDQKLEVVGVLNPLPEPSHLPEIAGFVSFDTFDKPQGANVWYWMAYYTYVRLAEGADPAALEAKFPAFSERHIGPLREQYGMFLEFHLQPLKRIWLHSNLMAEAKTPGDMGQLLIFGAVGVLILVIASINFINLTTAKAARRATEVGVRKSLGARRGQLVRQFFGESALMVALAMIAGLILASLALPWFNRFTREPVDLGLTEPSVLLGLGALLLVVLMLAGSVPALAYTAFRPAAVLKGQLRSGSKGTALRRAMVIVQFVISVFMIIGTITAFQQMRYMMSRDTGFDKEQVIFLPLPSQELRRQVVPMKQRLLEHPAAIVASAAYTVPSRNFGRRIVLPEGHADNEVTEAVVISADHDFLETFGIELKEGRFFDPAKPSDSSAFVLNEAMVRKLEWADPLGKGFDFPPRGEMSGEVIGVIRDYNQLSLHSPVEPMVIHMSVLPPRYLSLRYEAGQTGAIVEHVKQVWDEFAPGWPYDYFFLDEEVNRAYAMDRDFGLLFGTFATLAIAIACLGLFGLAAFVAQQRTKEIGVRKVMGATTTNLMVLLTRDLLRWVIIANVVAWPLAWWATHRWLQDFAYRISPSPWVFLLALLISLTIAAATVSGHTAKAARANPVKSLRYE